MQRYLTITSSSGLLALLLVAACDEHQSTPPDAGTEPQVDAAVPAGPRAVVVSGDFDKTGIMSRLDLDTLQVAQNVSPAGGVAGDPVVRKIGGKLYVINRFGSNNVSVYDAEALAFEEQYATGANTNPQDVAIAGNFMYVAVLGGKGVVKVRLSDGVASALDLGPALGDPDGNPDCVSAYAIGNKVFVACGLLDDFFSPRGNGKVAVIDTSNDSITVVTLPEPNPQGWFVRSPDSSVFGGDLLIPTTPSYTTYTTGCIARVSVGATPSAQCAAGLGNDDVGGFQTRLDVAAGGDLLWMAVGTLDSSFQNPTGTLRAFDLASGALSDPTSPSTQLIGDVAACPDGSVVAVDRTMNAAGLRVYKDNAERTTAALAFGLPPAFGNNIVCY